MPGSGPAKLSLGEPISEQFALNDCFIVHMHGCTGKQVREREGKF